jgi:hypothetical protein
MWMVEVERGIIGWYQDQISCHVFVFYSHSARRPSYVLYSIRYRVSPTVRHYANMRGSLLFRLLSFVRGHLLVQDEARL